MKPQRGQAVTLQTASSRNGGWTRRVAVGAGPCAAATGRVCCSGAAVWAALGAKPLRRCLFGGRHLRARRRCDPGDAPPIANCSRSRRTDLPNVRALAVRGEQAAVATAASQELTLWATFSAGPCRDAVARFRCAALYMSCAQRTVGTPWAHSLRRFSQRSPARADCGRVRPKTLQHGVPECRRSVLDAAGAERVRTGTAMMHDS
jgi:hypothetical protein